jgi:serine protease inhibitor ecotin
MYSHVAHDIGNCLVQELPNNIVKMNLLDICYDYLIIDQSSNKTARFLAGDDKRETAAFLAFLLKYSLKEYDSSSDIYMQHSTERKEVALYFVLDY